MNTHTPNVSPKDPTRTVIGMTRSEAEDYLRGVNKAAEFVVQDENDEPMVRIALFMPNLYTLTLSGDKVIEATVG